MRHEHQRITTLIRPFTLLCLVMCLASCDTREADTLPAASASPAWPVNEAPAIDSREEDGPPEWVSLAQSLPSDDPRCYIQPLSWLRAETAPFFNEFFLGPTHTRSATEMTPLLRGDKDRFDAIENDAPPSSIWIRLGAPFASNRYFECPNSNYFTAGYELFQGVVLSCNHVGAAIKVFRGEETSEEFLNTYYGIINHFYMLPSMDISFEDDPTRGEFIQAETTPLSVRDEYPMYRKNGIGKISEISIEVASDNSIHHTITYQFNKMQLFHTQEDQKTRLIPYKIKHNNRNTWVLKFKSIEKLEIIPTPKSSNYEIENQSACN